MQDLVTAASYLEEHHDAQKLLLDNYLGGAAVIFGVQFLLNIKMFAIPGAPFDPQHVTHLLKSRIK